MAELTEDVEFQELSRRVERIEGSLQRGKWGDTPEGLSRQVEELDVGHKHLQGVMSDHNEDFQAAVEALKLEIEEINSKLNLTMRALGNSPAGPELGKKKIPEPRAGARDARDLEHFLFDVEQYFKANQVQDEETKVTMASMYLAGDAKLWWRTKYEEIQHGRCVIDSWADLKRELKAQFLPENVEYQARRQLRELKHTGTVREYVKQFSALMLDIKDMAEYDKLFYFMEGHKPWARTELQRITDLSTAQAAAERLTDYASDPKPRGRNDGVFFWGANPKVKWGSPKF